MIKRMLLVFAIAATTAMALPHRAVADRCTDGRITAFTPNSITVYDDNQLMTFNVDGRTRFTKWITQGPWQQQTELRPYWLSIGQLVYVHQRHDGTNTARWIQVASDEPLRIEH
jgi:hypothetical protein